MFLITVINYFPALHGVQTLEDLTLSTPLYRHLPDVQESQRDKILVMPKSFMDLWSENAFHLQYLNRCTLMSLHPRKETDFLKRLLGGRNKKVRMWGSKAHISCCNIRHKCARALENYRHQINTHSACIYVPPETDCVVRWIQNGFRGRLIASLF